jgi:hypothetical protein
LVSLAQSKKNPKVSAKTVAVPFLHVQNITAGTKLFCPGHKGTKQFCPRDKTFVPGTRVVNGRWEILGQCFDRYFAWGVIHLAAKKKLSAHVKNPLPQICTLHCTLY